MLFATRKLPFNDIPGTVQKLDVVIFAKLLLSDEGVYLFCLKHSVIANITIASIKVANRLL